MKSQRKGFTLTELIVLIICTALLLSMTAIITSCGSDIDEEVIALRTQDGENLRKIHQALVTLSDEQQGIFPTPGLTRRDDVPGNDIPPGMEPEDASQNTTANLYSLLVMEQAVSPEVLVSPLERNPAVEVIPDYDYDARNPYERVFWDTAFAANLETGANASYAHLVLHGDRKQREWRNTQNSMQPILSNRGPRGGVPDPPSYTTDDTGQWSGHVVTNDGSVQWHETMTPPGITYSADDGTPRQDNIFEVEDGWGGTDAILSFTLEIGGDEPVIQHD